MNIHFASMIGAGIDNDLRGPWSSHYLSLPFDSYTAFVHVRNGDTEPAIELCEYLKARGFHARIITGEYRNGKLREEILSDFSGTLDGNDYLVTADSDEFHALPPDRAFYGPTDIISGILRDRYDSTLHDAVEGISLYTQYPFSGDVVKEIIRRHPDTEARWPRTNPYKIIGARVNIPVNFHGSHVVIGDMSIYSQLSGYPIDHYRWRGSIFDRLAGKGYYEAGHLWYVKEFFNVEETPPALQKMINRYELLEGLSQVAVQSMIREAESGILP